jgi:methylmalonyl-CoA/ethylmalonyl-CoA epimerase
MITGLSHVSIAVPSLEAAAKKLKETYGLAVGEAKTNEQQGVRLAYVELGNARIELMEPARPDSSISKFLQSHPAGGIHHFCLNVDELAPTAAAIAGKGARVLGADGETRNVHGERIAFVHPRDFLGALVDLEERHGG